MRLIFTPMAAASWATICANCGISRKSSVISWVLKPALWPAAASSDLACVRFWARWATDVLVDGNTGAKGESLPRSA